MTIIYNFRLGAWQRQFLVELFRVLVRMRGRVNFTNMARYSAYCEQTFRRHFRKAFGWVALNLTILRLRRHPKEPLIGVFRRNFCGCTFVPKSGTESYGIGQFFSSAAGRSERGQEVSILGVVATKSRATRQPSASTRRRRLLDFPVPTPRRSTLRSTSTSSRFRTYKASSPRWAFPTGSETDSTQNGRYSGRSLR